MYTAVTSSKSPIICFTDTLSLKNRHERIIGTAVPNVRETSTAGRLHEYYKNNSTVKNVNFMNEICSKMYEELPQNKSIKHYADMCCLSVDRFSHSFKESMGISPMGYIMNMRVRTACELLSNTNLTLAAVAENVGITDVNYFCRMIKKYTGNTPGHYRK